MRAGAVRDDPRSMPIIEVSGLRKVYGGRPVVDGVTFAVEEGEIFGILGPNGAGKTTTVECLEGLRQPDAGAVRVAGLDPRTDRAELTGLLGVQLQESEPRARPHHRGPETARASFRASAILKERGIQLDLRSSWPALMRPRKPAITARSRTITGLDSSRTLSRTPVNPAPRGLTSRQPVLAPQNWLLRHLLRPEPGPAGRVCASGHSPSDVMIMRAPYLVRGLPNTTALSLPHGQESAVRQGSIKADPSRKCRQA